MPQVRLVVVVAIVASLVVGFDRPDDLGVPDQVSGFGDTGYWFHRVSPFLWVGGVLPPTFRSSHYDLHFFVEGERFALKASPAYASAMEDNLGFSPVFVFANVSLICTSCGC